MRYNKTIFITPTRCRWKYYKGIVMRLSKLSSAIVLSTLLSACGGEDAALETKPQLSLVSSETQITLPESESSVIPLTLTNAQGEVKFSFEEVTGAVNTPAIKISVTNVTFVSNELYQDREYRFKITATDSNQSKAGVFIDVSGVNTSAIVGVKMFNAHKENHDSLIAGSEGIVVASAMYRVLNTIGAISDKIYESNIATVNSITDIESEESVVLSEMINASIPVDEFEMNNALFSIEDKLSKRSGAINSVISGIQKQHSTIFPEMDLDGTFLLRNGSVSQFYGNSQMGEGDESSFTFSDEYAFLNAVLFPESQPCALSE